MPRLSVNGVELFYETAGKGDPLVLVHGSWGDHSTWQALVPALAESFRVVMYDRRGHSQSERPPGQGSRRQDEDDLAALLEALDCAPAHVTGNSFGASIALGLAARRPELFRSAIAHEPPLMAILADDPAASPQMQEVRSRVESVLERLERGDIPGGARQFIENVALGPGMWEQLPTEVREIAMSNASTFLDEQRDPEWASLDLIRLSCFSNPLLLTSGDQSPPWLRGIVMKLDRAIAGAEMSTIAGSGHVPHLTHPRDYVATLTSFIGRSRLGRARSPGAATG